MKLTNLVLCFIFFILSDRVQCQENSQKTFVFDGYTLSDSLEYSAESIEYLFDQHMAVLSGNATVNYRGNILKSHTITYYEDYNYMEAVGEQDSSGTFVHTPVFKEKGGEELHGLVIKYNLKTDKGYVIRGRTQYESGFMAAERIKRSSDDTLFVANGTYTTCDIKEYPHFYFAGKKMKFIINDKLIIKPIVAYIHDIPVFWFPFYVFPIAKGRQSGFLTPRYGSSRWEGRYLSNLGYYFALSEYMDYKLAGSVRERNGWLVNNWFNYNKKDSISGSLFGSFENRTDPVYTSRQWKLRISHSHIVSPTLSITGAGRFESSTYSQYNSRNIFERLNRDMRSTLSIRKIWKGSGNSLLTTMTYSKNLDTQATELSLPNISFRKSRKLLFGSDTSNNIRRKYSKVPISDETKKWYNNIYYSLNASLNNTNTKNKMSSYYDRNMTFSSNLSGSYKFLGWLISEPSLNLNENFIVTNKEKNVEQYRRLDNVSTGISLGTTIYGMFKPSFGSLVALRHVVTPNISYAYGKRRSLYGDNADIFFRFDRNEEKQGRVSSMRINLLNLFQAKLAEGEKEKKIDLFRLNFSSSVNFEKKDRPIEPLQTTLDIKPQSWISTRLTAYHDFYHDDNKLHIISPYLDNLNITTSIGLSQQSLGFIGRSSRDNVNMNLGRDDFDMDMVKEVSQGNEVKTESQPRQFNLRCSHSYGMRRRNLQGKDSYTTTQYIKPTLSFSPSRNFSVQYYCHYDLEKKSMVFQNLVINRDLHCWEASISWVPSGLREGFYFKVNIKELPDVKIEKRRGSSSISY
ncbi:MAG TPA: putative LPS assembly protein LptD [Anaerolineae bacterium]|nr:putative LPS assembly protein LptD [Anaerolineae bacterium]